MGRAPLKLGFAFNLGLRDKTPEATARLYDEVIATIRYAEQVGLDGVWVGQHHFDITPGPVPSPLVLLAAVARETARIALGTGIVSLPLEDPLRLAEDAVVLDVLARGRLHLGLGTGGANLGAFEAWGLNGDDRHRLYDEKLARLNTALAGESLTTDSTGTTDVAGPRLQPYLPGLPRRVWEGVTSEQRARAAARADHGIQVGAFFDPAGAGQHPKVAAYVDELTRVHPQSDPRVGAFRFLYLGDDKNDVVREVEPVLAPKLPFLAERGAQSGNTTLKGLSVRDYLDSVAIYGSPSDVVDGIRADPVLRDFGTHLVANASFHDTFDAEHARRQIDALVGEVGPSLGWRPDVTAGTVAGADVLTGAGAAR
ncbi:LLM class flavin-dependent oxidoreductase [Herbiconiux daphne]|uniref:LLM class flavin-dependent oxidoreductase n=1 Tax=Herbiconiux daphne TaxID=2970914 RepID=A0ABT2H8M3_9MICO|nr:LLM class flavin-dependent oxidoreductase [Herbiconiux daphne]MCS5736306.1 LLM class flavin-dependent oxidoreductase [Herbiconiux daphne]